ncbi:MAG TPA: siroheme synthase, partial [Erythrobacter sp.]|nr:siroheme synthase [Erythrobacter sp.]
ALDPFEPASAEGVDGWLDRTRADDGAQVVDVTLASDDPEDLTIRQARALGRADTVLHDPQVPETILIRARADAARAPLPAEAPASGLTVILRRS